MSEDSPFGANAEIGVGFSDAALVVVSVAGFLFLGVTIFNIILLRLKTREEIEKEEETSGIGEDYEHRLVHADVANLSRAERRARARVIMKQKRRVQPVRPPQQNNDPQLPLEEQPEAGHEPQEGGADHPPQALVAVADPEDAAVDDSDDGAATASSRLSRKERQKMAKAVEKEERKVMEEERREHQRLVEQAAQKERREREKRQAAHEQEERQQQEQQKLEAEAKRLWEYNTFLSGNSCTVSVEEWVQELKQEKNGRVVVSSSPSSSIQSLAERFDVAPERVVHRIQELLEQRRVTGVLSRTRFVYITNDELEQIANLVRQRRVVSAAEVAVICDTIVNNKNNVSHPPVAVT